MRMAHPQTRDIYQCDYFQLLTTLSQSHSVAILCRRRGKIPRATEPGKGTTVKIDFRLTTCSIIRHSCDDWLISGHLTRSLLSQLFCRNWCQFGYVALFCAADNRKLLGDDCLQLLQWRLCCSLWGGKDGAKGGGDKKGEVDDKANIRLHHFAWQLHVEKGETEEWMIDDAVDYKVCIS